MVPIVELNNFFKKLFLSINKNSYYFYASIISFLLSIVSLNILNLFFETLIAAKLTLILIFFLNFLILVKFYKIKKKKETLFFIFILSSLSFRIIEYYLFKLGLNYIVNINFIWVIVFFGSYIVKFFFYNILLNNKFFHND